MSKRKAETTLGDSAPQKKQRSEKSVPAFTVSGFSKEPNGYTLLNLTSKTIKKDDLNSLQQSLKVSKSVEDIVLDHSHIGRKDLGELLKSTLQLNNIKYLSLRGVRLHEEHIECLSNQLKGNTTLKTLLLDKTTINDNKAKYIAAAIKENNSLTYVSLSENLMTKKGEKLLTTSIENKPKFQLLMFDQRNLGHIPLGAFNNIPDNDNQNTDNTSIVGNTAENADPFSDNEI